MAVWIDLQAELTIVSTSQTKHLIPCFQYEFDIQQYFTTSGGQCWGSDPQCRGRWKDWYYHHVGHETSIAMVKKYKRVQVVLCQDVQQFGWATCQRLSLCSTSFPMISLSTGCSLTWGVMRDRRQHILSLLFGMPHRVTLTQQIFHIPG